MRLQARLALSLALTALPLAAGTVWLRADLERRALLRVLREYAVTRMEEGGGRERCEAAPETFPRPRPRPGRGSPTGERPPGPGDLLPPGPRRTDPPPPPPLDAEAPPPAERETRLWAYWPALHSSNPRAPELASELVAAIRSGDDIAGRRLEGEAPGYEALVRMGWETGPCAFVLVRREGEVLAGTAVRSWWTGALLAGGLTLVAMLSLGPVVRRIRRLEEDVRASAAEEYSLSIGERGSDEVGDLARAFDEAAGRVREQLRETAARERTLRDFVDNTTHDLMTPLTVLQGHLALLRRRLEEQSDEETWSILVDAVREVDYTTSLIRNLGTVAKLDTARADPVRHPIDMNELVDRVVARYAPVARMHGIILEHAVPAEPVELIGDVTLLEQAIGNVVQNAIRYNRPGGHVVLLLRRPDNGFVLRVEDDGPGIPAAERARVLERGNRGSAARTRGSSGHGLGLAITREVCAMHGLDFALEESEFGGLAVVFRADRRADELLSEQEAHDLQEGARSST